MGISQISDSSNNAYALVVGINDFAPHLIYDAKTGKSNMSEINSLYRAEKSADQMVEILQLAKSGLFGTSYQYQKIIQLKSKEATLLNVVNGILELARISKPGDVISMSFSTHGLSKKRASDAPNANTMFLYDLYFSESQLMVLLRFFQPGIRFYIQFDMCQAGTWLDSFANDYMALNVAVSQLEADLTDTAPELAKFLLNHQSELCSGELPNTLLTYNGIHDSFDMNDCANSIFFLNEILVVKSRQLLKHSETYKLLRTYCLEQIFAQNPYFNAIYKNYFLKLNEGIDPEDPAYVVAPKIEHGIFDKGNKLHWKIFTMYCPKFRFVGDDTQQYLDKNLFSVL